MRPREALDEIVAQDAHETGQQHEVRRVSPRPGRPARGRTLRGRHKSACAARRSATPCSRAQSSAPASVRSLIDRNDFDRQRAVVRAARRWPAGCCRVRKRARRRAAATAWIRSFDDDDLLVARRVLRRSRPPSRRNCAGWPRACRHAPRRDTDRHAETAVERAIHLVARHVAGALQPVEDRRTRPESRIDDGLEPRRQHARDVAGRAAARDVCDVVHRHLAATVAGSTSRRCASARAAGRKAVVRRAACAGPASAIASRRRINE